MIPRRDSKEVDEPRAGTDARAISLLERIADGIDGLREELRRVSVAATSEHASASDPDRLLSPSDVAAILGIDVRTLRTLRHEHAAPPCVMIGRAPKWRRSTIDAWLARKAMKART